MSPRTAPLPASLQRASREPGSLDDRILQAEQRLIAREENLRRRVGQLSGRVRAALQPRRLLAPLAGGAAGIAALVWLLRGRGPGRAAPLQPGHASPAAAAAPAGQAPWVRWIGFAWPLLPLRWRSRVSPATATTLITLGLPLVEKLVAAREAPPLQTMGAVDWSRFAGTWYEIGRLPTPAAPAGSGQARTEFTRRDDGEIDVLQHVAAGDEGHETVARLRVVPGGEGALLQWSRWPELLQKLPLAWSDRWILHVDADYREALVGTPDRSGLWLLSRRPRLPRERLRTLLQVAHERGFDIERLQFFGPG